MKLIKILKSNYFVFLIYFLLSLFVHLLSTNGQFNVIINGGDTDYPLIPSLELSNSIFAWKNEALGTPEFFPLSRFILSIIPFFNYFIFGTSSNILVFVLLWAIAGFGIYVLIDRLVGNKYIAFLSGLFYMMNPYSYLRYHTPTIHIQFSYILPPLLLFTLIQTVTSRINLKWGTIFYSLLMVLLIRTINLWSIFWLIVPLLVLLFKYSQLIKENLNYQKGIVLLFTSLLINLAVIFMVFSSSLNYIDETQKNILINYYRETQELISKGYNFLESLGGWGTYAWQNFISEEKPGWQAFSVFGFLSKSYLLILSLIVPIYVIFTNLKLKKLPLLLFLLILAFLMTGQGEPFGLIYTKLFSNLPVYKDLFRDTWGYWGGIYMFTLTIMFAYSLKEGLKDILKIKSFSEIFSYIIPLSVIIFALSLSFLLYFYPGNIIHRSWVTSVPNSYKEVSEYINTLPQHIRILPVPLTSQPFGYTETNWGYKGPDILNRLTTANLLDKHLNSIANQGYIDLIAIENFNDINSFKTLLNLTGTEYILLRKDFVDPEALLLPKNYDVMLSDNCFTKVKDTSLLSLYNYTCNDKRIPLFSSSSVVVEGDYGCISTAITTKNSNLENPLCLNPNISRNFSITNNFASIGFSSYPQIVRPNQIIKDVSINGIQISDEINISSNNVISLDLSSGIYDMFDLDLKKIKPNTCEKGVNNRGIIYNKYSNRTEIISDNKQVCVFSNVNKGDYSETEAILKIDMSRISGNKPVVKFYSENSKSDVLTIDLNNRYYFNSIYTIKEANNGDRNIIYIYFKDLSFIDNNTFVYFLMNIKKDYYHADLYDLRMIKLYSDFLNLKLKSVEIKESNNGLNTLEYQSYLGGTVNKVYLNNFSNTKAINFNNNYNSNWKVLTVTKDGKFDVLEDKKHHFVANGWSNGWYIDADIQNVWIIYLPQIIFLIGIFLSIIAILSFLLIA